MHRDQARRSPSSHSSSSNMSEVTIGQFRRLDHIGKGSFAEVFRGIHLVGLSLRSVSMWVEVEVEAGGGGAEMRLCDAVCALVIIG